MAAGNNQKLKMLYLAKIFHENTDESHGLTMQELIEALHTCQVNADRKTLYQDIELLRSFGMDIIKDHQGHATYYYLGSRFFELPELKLLVDSVQAAKFMTERKSRSLIKKLESLVSQYQAGSLQRQVIISGRVKSMNESVYYNVDTLHEAIGAGRQISFHYYYWNVDKEQVLKNNGDRYHVSPWRLLWDDEYYYLIGYDEMEGKIKHFRVDKMRDIILSKKERAGREAFKDLDPTRYSKSLFGMFGGEETLVSLEAENSLAGVLIDRFGKDPTFVPVDDDHFQVRVNVVPSQQFFGWVFGLGSGIRIVGPDEVLQKMQDAVGRLADLYK
jgi:predicted DNA-binding transcriptional regulator YafY